MISLVKLDCGVTISLSSEILRIENSSTQTSLVIDQRVLPKGCNGAKVILEIAEALSLMVKKQ